MMLAIWLTVGVLGAASPWQTVAAPASPGFPAGPEAPASPSFHDAPGLGMDGPSPGAAAPGQPAAELPRTSDADIPPMVSPPAQRPRKKPTPGGSTSAELRLVLDTSARFRTRLTLGYSELVGPRLGYPWLNNVTAGNYVDFELGSVDPKVVSQLVERSSYLQVVPWSVGWTLALGHNPSPWRKFGTKPLSSTLRLSSSLLEMQYRDPADLRKHREFRVPMGADVKVQWAPVAYVLPLVLRRDSPLVRGVTALDGVLLYASAGVDHGWSTPRMLQQWCRKSGSAAFTPQGSGKPLPLQNCGSIYTGEVGESAGVSGTLYAGYMDPRANAWRVFFGPSLSYSRSAPWHEGDGTLTASLAMPVRVDLAGFVGGGKSPVRGVVELKPSLRASSKAPGKVDDYGMLIEMTVYLQQLRAATGLTVL